MNARTRTQKYWLVLVKQPGYSTHWINKLTFQWKVFFPMKVYYPRQPSLYLFLQTTSAAGFAWKECLAFPSFIWKNAISAMACLMMPNYFYYFWLLIHVWLCPDCWELSVMTPEALPVVVLIGSEFSISQVAFGLFFPRCISFHLSLLKVTYLPFFAPSFSSARLHFSIIGAFDYPKLLVYLVLLALVLLFGLVFFKYTP